MNVVIHEIESIGYGNIYKKAKEELNTQLIKWALEESNGNQCETARILGINRGTLRKMVKQYQIQLQYQSINTIG